MDIQTIIFTVGLVILGVGLLYVFIRNFINAGKDKQIEMVKEWLLLAVIEAEKQLGGGTGELKLRFVYDLFINRFKYLAYLISFESFSELVDEALVKMRHLIESNELIKSYTNTK